MKLFVWCNPYPVSYGTSMVFAIAETEEEARHEAANGRAYSFGEFDQPSAIASKITLGKPNRVVDLPCAEWHEWSE